MRDLRRKAPASTKRAGRENPKTLNKLDAKSKPKQNEAGEEGDKQIALFTLTHILYLAANGSSKLVSAQSAKKPHISLPKTLDLLVGGGGQPLAPGGKLPPVLPVLFYSFFARICMSGKGLGKNH